MSEQTQALRDYCLSQPEKPERISTYEFYFQLQHEIRMGAREREQKYRDSQTNPT